MRTTRHALPVEAITVPGGARGRARLPVRQAIGLTPRTRGVAVDPAARQNCVTLSRADGAARRSTWSRSP